MRIHDISVAPPPVKTIVFPNRLANGKDLVLRLQPVMDLDIFNERFPAPDPYENVYPDGRREKDYQHPNYIEAMNKWATQKHDWIILESLKATEGLHWDTVDYDKPETWCNWKTELKGLLSDLEIALLIGKQSEASCLSREMIDEATASFLRQTQEIQNELGSLQGGQPSTPSGEPVKD